MSGATVPTRICLNVWTSREAAQGRYCKNARIVKVEVSGKEGIGKEVKEEGSQDACLCCKCRFGDYFMYMYILRIVYSNEAVRRGMARGQESMRMMWATGIDGEITLDQFAGMIGKSNVQERQESANIKRGCRTVQTKRARCARFGDVARLSLLFCERQSWSRMVTAVEIVRGKVCRYDEWEMIYSWQLDQRVDQGLIKQDDHKVNQRVEVRTNVRGRGTNELEDRGARGNY